MNKIFHYFIYSATLLLCFSCNKSKYLDAVPNKQLVIPSTLADFQAILDNDRNMNGIINNEGLSPSFGEAGSDDYYSSPAVINTSLAHVNMYEWNDDFYSYPFTEWVKEYRSIFYSNLVLDGLTTVTIANSEQTAFNNIKGSALFFRANMYYQLAQVYGQPYAQSSSNTDLGLPIRLTSDINEKIQRASVQQTYDRIIGDLKEASGLLPVTPLYRTRPSKPAAFALLAKVYLAIMNYDQALLYADSCLQLQNALLDYKSINGTVYYPFQRFNSEVIFQNVIQHNLLTVSFARVDSNLYKSYQPNDLRKTLFFKLNADGGYEFTGSYDGTYELFGGLAADEVYLIRSECNARKNNVSQAMNDLNALLQKRYDNTFSPLTAINSADALNKILTERRKELVFRGTRWTDLRRLNKEGANITITRVFNGQSYILPPNSLKYTYLIPPDVMGFNPGMQQNPR